MKNNYVTQEEFFELMGKMMETYEHGQTAITTLKQEHDQSISEIMSSMELLLHKVNAMEEVIEMMTKYINDNINSQ